MIQGMGGTAGAATASGATAVGLSAVALGTAVGAAVATYATTKEMPKLAAKEGARGIDYATGGATDANPMAGMAPERPFVQDWWKSTMPAWLGGTPSAPIPVEVKSLPQNAGPQQAPTIPGAATTTGAGVGGSSPITAEVKSPVPVNVTGEVTGTGTLSGTLTIAPSPLFTARLDGFEAKLTSIAGKVSQVGTNGPGSTGKSSPDAGKGGRD